MAEIYQYLTDGRVHHARSIANPNDPQVCPIYFGNGQLDANPFAEQSYVWWLVGPGNVVAAHGWVIKETGERRTYWDAFVPAATLAIAFIGGGGTSYGSTYAVLVGPPALLC